VIAVLTLIILFLTKDNPHAYYALPAIMGLAIITNNYYILTCTTTTLFLKGMADYSDIKNMKWSDKRVSMFIYLTVTTVAVILIAGAINVTTV
jgi:uncharacterized membrane protein